MTKLLTESSVSHKSTTATQKYELLMKLYHDICCCATSNWQHVLLYKLYFWRDLQLNLLHSITHFSVSNVNLLLRNILWSFASFMWASLVYLHIRKKLPLVQCLIHDAVLSLETSQLREREWPGPTPRPPSLAAEITNCWSLNCIYKILLIRINRFEVWELSINKLKDFSAM